MGLTSLVIFLPGFLVGVMADSPAGCMNADATFFQNNFPPKNSSFINYFTPEDIQNGILPPCPPDEQQPCFRSLLKKLAGEDESCRADKDLKNLTTCPCIVVKHKDTNNVATYNTCPESQQLLVFNSQKYLRNSAGHIFYSTTSIFSGSGEEEQVSIDLVIGKTPPNSSVCDKYVYITGFAAKNIEGFYVTIYARLRLCLLHAATLLGIKMPITRGSKLCNCPPARNFNSVNVYSLEPSVYSLPPDTRLFTIINQTINEFGTSTYTFEPSTAKDHEITCTSKENCTSISCPEKVLVKCCVAGICKCVSNPKDTQECLPCYKSGALTGGLEACNEDTGIFFSDFYSINKIVDNCNSGDVSFEPILLPSKTTTPCQGVTLIIAHLLYTQEPYQYVWFGNFSLTAVSCKILRNKVLTELKILS